MNRWLASVVALGALLLVVSPSFSAAKMEVKGVIAITQSEKWLNIRGSCKSPQIPVILRERSD
jgi:hypothetical protein